MSPTSRVVTTALLGALAGAAALAAVFSLHPGLIFELDRDPPGRVLTGFYPAEIAGEESFAWTSERAQAILPGLDRRVPWRCAVRFRGGRPADIAQPTVDLALDGTKTVSRSAANEYQDMDVLAPPRTSRGLRLTMTSSTTFLPGPSDPRRLGVQVDRVSCVPEAGAHPLPPGGTFLNAALTAAIFGGLFGLAISSMRRAAVATLIVAAVQAFPLARQLGPYTAYADRVVWLAFWIAAPAFGGLLWARVKGRQAAPAGLSFGVAFSAAALFVKLLALLHPSKPVIDALFHAHRLEYVLGGRYFFTQVMPGGVQFPYAIALYVFASPWAALTRDHIGLLRIVVAASEAAAGLLLYWAIVRRWRDGQIAAWTLVLFHLLPVSYWIAGNANLTNAFGQSAALAAMSVLVVWRLGSRDWWQLVGLAALAAMALLSHVSTFALLAATMASAAVISLWRGGRPLLPVARSIVLALALAVIASVGLYYGRPEFYDAYKSVRGARTESAAAAAAESPAEVDGSNGKLAEGAIPVMSLSARVGSAIGLGGDTLGWPILALGLLGLWRLVADRAGDRLTWAIAAWGAASGVFFLFGIVAPGGVGHQRQAMEFIARAVYAGSPAVLILAGLGGVWAWRAGGPLRVAAAGSVTLALYAAARMWVSWWG